MVQRDAPGLVQEEMSSSFQEIAHQSTLKVCGTRTYQAQRYPVLVRASSQFRRRPLGGWWQRVN